VVVAITTAVGHAYLKIMPSLQGLGRHLRDQIRESERTAPAISLTAQVQTALLREQLRVVAREGDQTAIRLLAELDSRGAETEFQSLVRRLSGQSVRLHVVTDKAGGFARLTASVGAAVLKFGALAAAAGAAMGAVNTVGAAVATASGSLLLIPAAGLAAAAAIGTLKLGLHGFSDALSESDPAKFAEALSKMAPAAASTALAVRALQPEFTGLRLSVQQELFRGLSGEVTALGRTYLPILRTGLSGIAGELNNGAREVTAFGQSWQTSADVSQILANSRVAVGNLVRALAPLLQAFRDIVAVGSGVFANLTKGAGSAAQRFADFIAQARQSGQLEQWITNGLTALRQLGALLSNVLGIIGAIFNAANTSGGSLLGTLVEITGQIRAFLTSGQGATALGQIFTGLRAIVAGLQPVLLALGQMITTSVAPAIQQLGTMIGQAFAMLAPALEPLGRILASVAPVLGAAAQTIAQILVPAIQLLAPIVAQVAGPLTDVIQRVGELVSAFLKLDIVRGVFETIGNVIEGALKILRGAIDLVLGMLTGDWSRAWSGLKDIVSGAFDGILRGVVQHGANLLAWIAELPLKILGALGNLGGLLLEAGASIIRGLVDGIASGFRWVKDKLGELTDWITDWKGPPARDRVLLAPNGRLIMQGLLSGLRDEEPAIRDYLTNLTTSLPVTVQPVSGASQALTGASVGASTPPVPTGWQAEPGLLAEAVTAGVLAALDGARMQVDGAGVARLVNTVNARNARR
jgi:phage-related protein